MSYHLNGFGALFDSEDEDAQTRAQREATGNARCYARAGVCRDITREPPTRFDTVVRGLCSGPANIVCVIPGGALRPGGPPAPAPTPRPSGGAPAPGTPLPPPPPAAPTPDWGQYVLIGGAVALGAAVLLVLAKTVKSRRMARAVASTPVNVLPSPVANRRRRSRRKNPTEYVLMSKQGQPLRRSSKGEYLIEDATRYGHMSPYQGAYVVADNGYRRWLYWPQDFSVV